MVLLTIAPQASAAPRILSYIQIPDACFGMDVEGNRAFITLEHGLQVVDISNPEAPALLGRALLPSRAYGVRVRGPLAYVACSDSGLCIVDVSAPGFPIVGRLPLGAGLVRALALNGNILYMTWGGDYHWLAVVDVTDPRRPVLLTSINVGGRAYDIQVGGPDYAYVSAGDAGLVTLRITDPARPEVVSTLPLDGETGALDIVGRYAYLVQLSRTDIIDLSDPASPRLVAVQPGGFRFDVGAAGRFMCLAAGMLGMEIVDILVPASPRLLATLPTQGSAGVVAVRAGRAYVLTSNAYLQINDLAQPDAWHQEMQAPSLSTIAPAMIVRPNPVRGRTEIAYEQMTAGFTEVAVYGMDGRRLRILMNGTPARGPQRIIWDGRDEAGRRLPPGIYLVRVTMDGPSIEAKVVLVP